MCSGNGQRRPKRLAALFGLICLAAAPALSLRAQSPDAPMGMFALYAKNRADNIPNAISEDFVLLSYSMTLQAEVEAAEVGLQRDVSTLVRGLSTALAKEDQKEPGVVVARRFAAILVALAAETPTERRLTDPEAVKELAAIDAASAMQASAVTGLTVDFSQMKPRGRYTRSEEATRYFRTMRYASLLLFPLRATQATKTNDEQVTNLTAAAALISRTVAANEPLSGAHSRMLSRTLWLFGEPDDLTVGDYVKVLAGDNAKWPAARMREELTKAFQNRPPRIVGEPIETGGLPPGMSAQGALLGWRLAPSRLTPDRVALQQLVYGGSARTLKHTGTSSPRSLTNVRGAGPVRGFPLADDLFALLGSELAAKRLGDSGERDYEGYQDAVADAAKALTGAGTLGSEHLAIFKMMVTTNSPDATKLNAALGMWTLDKHREVLYAKQSYTGVGKGVSADRRRQAWLDPSVETYVALRGQVDRAVAALGTSERLQALGMALDRLVTIAKSTRGGAQPPAEDVEFLNNLDTTFRGLVTEEDGPIATDIHTEPNSQQVLMEALAAPTVIEVPVGGDAIGRGALFTHVEFKHPMNDRLTDEKWRQMVSAGVPAAKEASARLREAFVKRMAAHEKK